LMEFLYALGRLHVVVLHIPLGVIVAILVLEWLVRREPYRHLEPAAAYLWVLAGASALLTVAFGYLHFAEGGFEGSSGYQHRTFGTTLAVIITVFAALRASRFARSYAPVFLPAAILVTLLATITGHFGGNLTHGSEYLVEYAPQPIRALAGLPPRRPPVTDLAMADPFHDIVGPILYSRCRSCHSPDQRQAELVLTSLEGVMRGGENGSVIARGRPDRSELMNRVTLPPTDESFMPAEGRTPLTERQVEIIEWWISIGAPADVVLGELDIELAAADRERLEAELGL
jgi:uncharacterized membrane protein